MILFLFITVIIELLGVYLKALYKADPIHVLSNSWLYNVYRIFEASFISLMFIGLFKNYINSKPIILSGLAILASLYIYETIIHTIFKKHNLMASTMSVLFVIYSLYYFYHLVKDDNYYNLKYSPSFWWVTGVLFFYFGDTALNLIFEKILFHKITPNYYPIGTIYQILNVLIYSCWSYAFICKKWLTVTSKTLY
jgi:hypothetical protein